MFLDEPTSSLDSFSALKICKVLKSIANAGSSVLFTIHQPSSEIFNSFDHLLLLNEGCLMYQGPIEDVASYFAGKGYGIPVGYNTADWIIHVSQSSSLEDLEKQGFFPMDKRVIAQADEINLVESNSGPSHVSVVTEIVMLFQREIRAIYRDSRATLARYGITSLLGLLIGTIFFGVGKTNPEVYSVSLNYYLSHYIQ